MKEPENTGTEQVEKIGVFTGKISNEVLILWALKYEIKELGNVTIYTDEVKLWIFNRC